MSRKIKKRFYEVQQSTGYDWHQVGYFRTKQAAEKHIQEFNTKVMINPLRILEREFLE